MRTFLILGMFTASLAHAAWRDYEETRDLTLDAGGIDTVVIEAGAGSLEVRGSADAKSISVTALIQVPDKEEKAQKGIESDLVLTLERDGDSAVLNDYFESSGWNWGDISIDDGSGSITVKDVRGSVVIDDGSGGIKVTDVDADLIIEDDGSGSLNFARINGRVEKDD